MRNCARIGVVIVATTLAGLIGVGAANATPQASAGGNGSYAAGSAESAQLLPGTYRTEGSLDHETPCRWSIHRAGGFTRVMGSNSRGGRIEIVEGETLETRNCQDWVLQQAPIALEPVQASLEDGTLEAPVTMDQAAFDDGMLIAGASLAQTAAQLLRLGLAALTTFQLMNPDGLYE